MPNAPPDFVFKVAFLPNVTLCMLDSDELLLSEVDMHSLQRPPKGIENGITRLKSIKNPATVEVTGFLMAAGEGFEPSQTESESVIRNAV